MKNLLFGLIAVAIAIGGAFLALLVLVSRALFRATRAAEGRGWSPVLATMAAAVSLGVALLKAADARASSEHRALGGVLANVLPAGGRCDACLWASFEEARRDLWIAIGIGIAIAVVVAGPTLFEQARAAWRQPPPPRDPQLDPEVPHGSRVGLRERCLLQAGSLVLLLGLGARVVARDRASPGWPARDPRWGVAQAQELFPLGSKVADEACERFRTSAESAAGRRLAPDAPMADRSAYRDAVASLALRCLRHPPKDYRGQGTELDYPFPFFGGPAWTSLPQATRDAWVVELAQKTPPCDFFASGAAQCEAIPHASASERERLRVAARVCLDTRGCYPYSGGDNWGVRLLTLGRYGDADARCGTHQRYLELVASDRSSVDAPSACHAEPER